MKTIGIIGGMSWESTALYYQIINREVSRRIGGLHSAHILLESLDFAEVVAAQRTERWEFLGEQLAASARRLAGAGADCILIATNTMHRVAPLVQAAVTPPLIHIGDVTGQRVRSAGLTRVLLLGTRYTMEQPFYRDHLQRLGIECAIPEEAERIELHRIIFEELCVGCVNPASRNRVRAWIAEAAKHDCQGVVLGCTELPLLLGPSDVDMPLFDTTRLHAMAAADHALMA